MNNQAEAAAKPLVRVIDDDDAMRRALAFLIESVELEVVPYASAAAFLASPQATRPGCLVLDVRMPGMSGLELQQVMAREGINLPIIFLTGHGEVSMVVNAMKAGAADFIEKPFRDQVLLEAVAGAVRRSCETRAAIDQLRELRHAFLDLTPREKEVARLVADGLPNKQIAAELGIAEKTVHVHRANALHKMAAGSAAELATLLIRLGEKR
ncbi:MAG: response regulator [Burkholderiaceae bacterium]